MSKLGSLNTVGSDIRNFRSGDNSRQLEDLMSANGLKQDEVGKIAFKEIELDRITPRSINNYSQTRIERLARSIRNTGNRLIHPIVIVRVKDLPEGSPIIEAYQAKGIDVSGIEFVIVAGERRYRAFKMLRDEEIAKGKEYTPFDKITCNILTKAEAQKEDIFYEDSNVEARSLTPMEGMQHLMDAQKDVQTADQKKAALIAMNGGSEEGIPVNPDDAAKGFNYGKWCQFYLKDELGIEGWSYSTVKVYLSILNNCEKNVIDAIFAGEYDAGHARALTKLLPDQQTELLELWKNGQKTEYSKRLKEMQEELAPEKAVFTSHKEASKIILDVSKRCAKEKKEIQKLLSMDGLPKADEPVIKKMLALIEQIEEAAKEIQ